jgi:hypothetical protein
MTVAGSNVGGLVGKSVNCNRYSALCLIYESSFDGSITSGQNIERLSNAGGLIGFAEGGMIVRSSAKGVVRGRAAVGGIAGYAQSMLRFIDTVSEVNVTSSTESHGGFIGRLLTVSTRFEPNNSYVYNNIYLGNSWSFRGQGMPPQDIGLWEHFTEQRRNIDVEGIDFR